MNENNPLNNFIETNSQEQKSKICIHCGQTFIPSDPSHQLCYPCYKIDFEKHHRRCIKCNVLIDDHPYNHKYCSKCFSKMNQNNH